jgi:hypothetical protein
VVTANMAAFRALLLVTLDVGCRGAHVKVYAGVLRQNRHQNRPLRLEDDS